MSNTSPVILYDIPSRDPTHCWSWNAWRTRLLLGLKGIDYVTEWTTYPNIKTKLEEHFPEQTEFTIPTVRLADGKTYVMDSYQIADRLESEYPAPSAHLDSPWKDRLVPNLITAMTSIRPIYIYLVLTRVLSDESIPYFEKTRAKDLGMSIDQYHRESDPKVCWSKSETGFRNVTTMLEENDGPFFMGQTLCYADIIWAGVLLFLRGLGDDVFSKVIEASGDEGKAYKALLEAVSPWSSRDSY